VLPRGASIEFKYVLRRGTSAGSDGTQAVVWEEPALVNRRLSLAADASVGVTTSHTFGSIDAATDADTATTSSSGGASAGVDATVSAAPTPSFVLDDQAYVPHLFQAVTTPRDITGGVFRVSMHAPTGSGATVGVASKLAAKCRGDACHGKIVVVDIRDPDSVDVTADASASAAGSSPRHLLSADDVMEAAAIASSAGAVALLLMLPHAHAAVTPLLPAALAVGSASDRQRAARGVAPSATLTHASAAHLRVVLSAHADAVVALCTARYAVCNAVAATLVMPSPAAVREADTARRSNALATLAPVPDALPPFVPAAAVTALVEWTAPLRSQSMGDDTVQVFAKLQPAHGGSGAASGSGDAGGSGGSGSGSALGGGPGSGSGSGSGDAAAGAGSARRKLDVAHSCLAAIDSPEGE
jgi:uncharacterized membrane protein YgcG